MAIPSFYSAELSRDSTQLMLSAEEAHHAIKARRLISGAHVRLFNGQGLSAMAVLDIKGRREVVATVTKLISHDKPDLKLTVACAIPKGDRIRTLIDMLTQLGVTGFVPVEFQYSSNKLAENTKVLEKWRRYSLEACKQSQNPWSLAIARPTTLSDFLKTTPHASYFLDHSGGNSACISKVLALNLIIGPEAGFSDQEFELFKSYEMQAIKIGTHILRTETAAVAGAAHILSAGHAGTPQ